MLNNPKLFCIEFKNLLDSIAKYFSYIKEVFIRNSISEIELLSVCIFNLDIIHVRMKYILD